MSIQKLYVAMLVCVASITALAIPVPATGWPLLAGLAATRRKLG